MNVLSSMSVGCTKRAAGVPVACMMGGLAVPGGISLPDNGAGLTGSVVSVVAPSAYCVSGSAGDIAASDHGPFREGFAHRRLRGHDPRPRARQERAAGASEALGDPTGRLHRCRARQDRARVQARRAGLFRRDPGGALLRDRRRHAPVPDPARGVLALDRRRRLCPRDGGRGAL